MIIVSLNGPIKSGKDAIAAEIVKQLKDSKDYHPHHAEMKTLLFDACIRSAGISKDLWFALYNDRNYKERPTPYLMINGEHVSPRTYIIHISENVLKPLFGNDVMGIALGKILDNVPCQEGKELFVVLSDGGFKEEMIPLGEKIGYNKFNIARIHRLKPDGTEYDFAGDSRSYVYANEVNELTPPNERDILNEEGQIHNTAAKIIDFALENSW